MRKILTTTILLMTTNLMAWDHEVIRVYGERTPLYDYQMNPFEWHMPIDLSGYVATYGVGGSGASREPVSNKQKKEANKNAKEILKIIKANTPSELLKTAIREFLQNWTGIRRTNDGVTRWIFDGDGNLKEVIQDNGGSCTGVGGEAVKACSEAQLEKMYDGTYKFTLRLFTRSELDGEMVKIVPVETEAVFYINDVTGDSAMTMLSEVVETEVTLEIDCLNWGDQDNPHRHGETFTKRTQNGYETRLCKYGNSTKIDLACDDGYSVMSNQPGITFCGASNCELGGFAGTVLHGQTLVIDEGRCNGRVRQITRGSCSFGNLTRTYDSISCGNGEVVGPGDSIL